MTNRFFVEEDNNNDFTKSITAAIELSAEDYGDGINSQRNFVVGDYAFDIDYQFDEIDDYNKADYWVVELTSIYRKTVQLFASYEQAANWAHNPESWYLSDAGAQWEITPVHSFGAKRVVWACSVETGQATYIGDDYALEGYELSKETN